MCSIQAWMDHEKENKSLTRLSIFIATGLCRCFRAVLAPPDTRFRYAGIETEVLDLAALARSTASPAP
jgi:hypothetical protein